MRIGDGVFVQIPGEFDHRVLHPAMILGIHERDITAELEERELPFECGEPILVYYEQDTVFMQQTARLNSYDSAEPGPLIEFELTGEPSSAESREHYRVSTVMANLTAELGNESLCPLLDVSSMGFSVIASEDYEIGNIVDAVLWYSGQQFAGKVCVQSIRELGKGRIRYGFHSLEDSRTSGNINCGLEAMSASIQRQQLQRLAGII